MTYVNEIVSRQDIDAYRLREVGRRYNRDDSSYAWTVDRATGSFLMYLGYNHEEPAQERFVFSWHGHQEILIMQAELLPDPDGARRVRWTPLRLPADGRFPVPEALSSTERESFVKALKDAFTAYQVAGLYSAMQYLVSFNF